MTVIFSNAGDPDCQTLRNLWKNVPGTIVIEINPLSRDWQRRVDQAIAAEDDTLIFCGHGTPTGLLSPDFTSYIFSEKNLHLVRAKQVLCIWCYAKSFCERVHLNCLTSSMYISNSMEASINGFDDIPQYFINETNEATFSEMNQLILTEVPFKEWRPILMSTLDTNNPIDTFNRGGMTFIE